MLAQVLKKMSKFEPGGWGRCAETSEEGLRGTAERERDVRGGEPQKGQEGVGSLWSVWQEQQVTTSEHSDEKL